MLAGEEARPFHCCNLKLSFVDVDVFLISEETRTQEKGDGELETFWRLGFSHFYVAWQGRRNSLLSDNGIHCTIYPYAYVNGKCCNLQAFHFTEVKPVKKKCFVAHVQSADRYGIVAPVSERADASSLSELFSYRMKWCDLEHSSALLQRGKTL